MSDRDVCVFIEEASVAAIAEERTRAARDFDSAETSVVVYPRVIADYMAARGSLFYWHLKIEGRILNDPAGYIQRLFESLASYGGYDWDLAEYGTILQGVTESCAARGMLNAADMHALFMVCRNLCILLTMKAGSPQFGRKSAFLGAAAVLGQEPLRAEVYRRLEDEHIRYTRGGPGRASSPVDASTAEIVEAVSALEARVAQALHLPRSRASKSLVTDIFEAIDLVDNLLSQGRRVPYSSRIALERMLFGVLQPIAQESGMGLSDLKPMVGLNLAPSLPLPAPGADDVLLLGVRILQALSVLTLGDPYATMKDGNRLLEGQAEIVAALRADLSAFRQRLQGRP